MDKPLKNVRSIFDEASEISDLTARAAFVVEECGGNETLQQRVEELLRAHDTAGGFLQGVNEPPTSVGNAARETIGRYELIEKLGEGGCGIVYLAEQQEPVKRRVALKVIKLGMDTRSVIARFEAERQALAMMDHPNIARVLDAGATETGRPFFVMELVQGIKITHYADENNLSTGDRLNLFVQVCHAIQHAHQKGIIHRDIKPSNILVSLHDGVAVPKVIDFGIAKATADLQLTDKTIFTHFELFLGTPAYMSPEQARMGGVDIDTRSDIYSLGVLLYELLTGRPPFDGEQLLRSGIDELRRAICETDALRPSTRLRQLSAQEQTSVAGFRATEPPRLVSSVRGDLDWIVLKALEKDRTRRYESASALATDVQRHLNDEPVGARPPSGLDLFQKLVRRNKLLFVAGSAVALAIVGGLGTSTVLFVKERQARREADVARINESRQRDQADAKAEESLKRLVRLHVERGNDLVDEGDAFGALPWLVEAVRLDQGDAVREDVHRRRVASILRGTPTLDAFWIHGALVNDAQFSADGARVVCGGVDRVARVWDARTGRPVTPPLPCGSEVEGVHFTPDGRCVLTIERGGTLRFWNATNGAALRAPLNLTASTPDAVDFSLDGRWFVAAVRGGAQVFDVATLEAAGPLLGHSNTLTYVRFSPDGSQIATAGAGSKVHLWDTTSWQLAGEPLENNLAVKAVLFTPDSQTLATLTTDSKVHLWDVATGRERTPPIRHAATVYGWDVSADGRWLTTADWGGAAHVWDTATGQRVGLPLRHRAGIKQAKFSPDGAMVATASWDSTACLWNPSTSQPVAPALRHSGFVLTVNFARDRQRLLTTGQDATVRLWQLPTNHPARLVLRHNGTAERADYSPDGNRILTTSKDGLARIWDRASGQLLRTFNQGASVAPGTFSPDGTKILIGGSDGSVRLWDVNSGDEIIPPIRHAKTIKRVEFSRDGRRFLTASDDGTARVWQASDGTPLTPPLAHSQPLHFANFSPDGRLVVTSGRDNTAQVWDSSTGARVGAPLQHDYWVGSAMFSPDGQRIVTSCRDAQMFSAAGYVWDWAKGERVGPPLQHHDGVRIAIYSPDGRFIATASEDNTAVIWNAATGTPATPPLRHRSLVWNVAFSPDSRFLVTCGNDRTARVWDTATGEPITPPLVHQAMVGGAAWSPDGKEVITCSWDGTACVWDVSPTTVPLGELQLQAELLSAHRLQTDIGLLPLSAAEMQQRWELSHSRRERGSQSVIRNR